jgi:DNA helicase-2/ATP-dependent DNA helicase PcrA
MANLDDIYGPEDRTRAFENHDNGYLVSLAGPGTGKTRSLLNRTEALTARGVVQNSICYLTFIKEISNAFVQDYIDKFGEVSYKANRPRISTLHSFACRLLRHQGFRIGYDGELFFANTADKDTDAAYTLLKDLLPSIYGPDCQTPAQLRQHIKSIKSAWRDTVDPLTLGSPLSTILQNATALFRAFRIVDWDQTIPLATTLIRGLGTLPQWITDIKHYYIDEYQDFNRAEQSLISFFAGHATSVVIVGDVDQSLYSSRGGLPDGLRNLYDNPTHDHVTLIKCFRCKEAIVTAANVFQRAMHDVPRVMLPTQGNGQILVYRFKSSNAELAYLAEYLQDCIAQTPDPPSSKDGTVCLFPSRRCLDSYFAKLSPLVPCARRKGELLPERLWLERILHLICRPNQRFLQRLLLNEYKQIKPRHKQSLIQRVVQRDITPVLALQSLITDGDLTGQAAIQSRDFCQFMEDINSKAPEKVAPHIASRFGTEVQLVANHLAAMIERLNEPELEELITQYADLLLPQSVQPAEDPRSILFLTMHGAKGLTKKNVVIPGLEAAWLPSTAQGAELDEQRRLFYVAITRATDRVLITFPLNRAKKDSLNFNRPGRGVISPFVAQAGLGEEYHT